MIFNTLLTIALTLLACANCFTSQLQQNRDELLDKPVEAYDHVPEHKYVETRDTRSLPRAGPLAVSPVGPHTIRTSLAYTIYLNPRGHKKHNATSHSPATRKSTPSTFCKTITSTTTPCGPSTSNCHVGSVTNKILPMTTTLVEKPNFRNATAHPKISDHRPETTSKCTSKASRSKRTRSSSSIISNNTQSTMSTTTSSRPASILAVATGNFEVPLASVVQANKGGVNEVSLGLFVGVGLGSLILLL